MIQRDTVRYKVSLFLLCVLCFYIIIPFISKLFIMSMDYMLYELISTIQSKQGQILILWQQDIINRVTLSKAGFEENMTF